MKNPWEMTQREFIAISPAKREPSQHRTEWEKAALKVAVKVGGDVFVGGHGEIHAQLILREALPAEKVITGFVDGGNRFHYQYPELAHKLEVEHALAEGRRVPMEVLRGYPDLDPGDFHPADHGAANEVSIAGAY